MDLEVGPLKESLVVNLSYTIFLHKSFILIVYIDTFICVSSSTSSIYSVFVDYQIYLAILLSPIENGSSLNLIKSKDFLSDLIIAR